MNLKDKRLHGITLKEFKKLIQGHKKLLIKIGKL